MTKIEQPKTLTPAKIKDAVVKTLKEYKAIDIKALNIKHLTDIADYMIITTANSTVHAKTLSDKAMKELRSLKIRAIGSEGEKSKEWMLVDFGDVILHIMLGPTRELYDLEKLWDITKTKINKQEPDLES